MKILLISDHEEKYLWDDWTKTTAEKLSDIDLILSAGDLHPLYLEFLVTMLNVPLVYVRGNHDGYYDERPPEGCDNADGQLVEVACGRGESQHNIRILGFGGSMRYKDGAADMYTEEEMYARVRKAERALLKRRALDVLFASAKKGGRAGLDLGPAFDILLTHAPCCGFGGMDDLPHRGFECFNYLLNKYSPQLHCYGHVHQEYGEFARNVRHPSGTLLINGSGYQIIDFETP
ncbi:MAG: metallophosphoesterase family protein [Mogibacterium sp.]|nr:metallophosphoesterase family protein [Mogibacterium sp.]